MRILVLGSGVIGLTCGVVLAESGHDVTIWARELPPETTSDVSAAIWYPYKCDPLEKVRRWSVQSLGEFQKLAAETATTGVRLVAGHKYFHRRMGRSWYADLGVDFELLGPDRVPPFCRAGYAFRLPVADMTAYLPYLEKRFLVAGGQRVRRAVRGLAETEGAAQIVVNATGLGAAELTGDRELFPIRGQVLSVPPLSRDAIVMDDDHPDGMIYVIPRLHDTILGGVAEEGATGLAPDDATSRAILARCAHYFPELRDVREWKVKVGLRPGRSAVRLEREGRVIHCYGHGGSGMSVSWGCAWEVRALIARG